MSQQQPGSGSSQQLEFVPRFSRSEWIAASHFHDLSDAAVLRAIGEQVSAARVRGETPAVLLDLDSTLYEVGPRTHAILSEWVHSPESAAFPAVREAVRSFEEDHVGYSLWDTFAAAGVQVGAPDVQAAIQELQKFWRARFFTSRYLTHDRVYPGAVDFVREVYRLGAETIYLTGRDEKGMGDGTRDRLRDDGFPWGTERTHLLLKAEASIPDVTHKVGAGEFVKKRGILTASLENEPPNIVALYDAFPQSMHVFVETVCSDHPAEPRRGLYRIKGYL